MNIRKVDTDFIRKSFSTEKTVSDYTKAVREIGLWESEKIMIKKLHLIHFFIPVNVRI